MSNPEHGVMRYVCGHELRYCSCTSHICTTLLDWDLDALCEPCRTKLHQPLTPTAPPRVTEPFQPATD